MTLGIVQARMGSVRLPGKSLVDIRGKPLLARVIERVRPVGRLTRLVLATTDLEADNSIATLCSKVDEPVFRGSESNVLDRFYRRAQQHEASVIVRFTQLSRAHQVSAFLCDLLLASKALGMLKCPYFLAMQ